MQTPESKIPKPEVPQTTNVETEASPHGVTPVKATMGGLSNNGVHKRGKEVMAKPFEDPDAEYKEATKEFRVPSEADTSFVTVLKGLKCANREELRELVQELSPRKRDWANTSEEELRKVAVEDARSLHDREDMAGLAQYRKRLRARSLAYLRETLKQ